VRSEAKKGKKGLPRRPQKPENAVKSSKTKIHVRAGKSTKIAVGDNKNARKTP